MEEQLQIRIHGDASLPALIYLPGIHGDWTLITSFRARVAGRVRFVEVTYPRTLTWSLDDYAAAIQDVLVKNGITSGWILAESFGSQVAWPLIRHSSFTPLGLILAGGFVRHPLPWGVDFAKFVARTTPMRLLLWELELYAVYARFRHRRAPETMTTIREFIARRNELDRDAAVHRLDLIRSADLEPIARAATLPVFALTGFFDPIVPWPFVFSWLRKKSPALRGTKILGKADHNVLSTAPDEAVAQVLEWMGENRTAGETPAAR
ncbi:MAG: alpha/beta hydrolase [Verrucomicrobia bacterium]|nr:alpha/beta hydrolase [Verrucomicrobiota bacterium]